MPSDEVAYALRCVILANSLSNLVLILEEWLCQAHILGHSGLASK